MDGADLKNLEELMKLARRTGVPGVLFQSFHKKREADATLKAGLLEDDDFGLAKELCLCKGARVLLTRNLWVEAGLVNGAQGIVRGYVWPVGGRPNSTTSSKRAPICVIVEFDDVQLGGRRFFDDESGLSAKCVPICHSDSRSEIDPNVVRQQFPLTLAWALTQWKAQGMTLKRVRVCLLQHSAKQVGVGFVAVTRKGHSSLLMFESDLPPCTGWSFARGSGTSCSCVRWLRLFGATRVTVSSMRMSAGREQIARW